MHVRIAGDASHVAERLFHRLSERNPDILSGMVMVDMQVTGRLDGDVDPGVPGKQVKHVIEKTDPCRNRCNSAAVKINCNHDVGFLGSALYRCLAHMRCLRARSLEARSNRGWRIPLPAPMPPRLTVSRCAAPQFDQDRSPDGAQRNPGSAYPGLRGVYHRA